MHTEHAFLLLFLAIAVFLFVRAHNEGVAPMLWSVAGICAGLIGGRIFYGLLPDLFPDWEAGFRTRLFLSALVAVVPYLVVRFAAKALLEKVFDPGGPLGAFADGVLGGILSLIPTLVTIAVVITCTRVAGTWAEFRRFEKVSVTGVDYLERRYPQRPMLANWRDSVERLPLVLSVFGVFDKINRVPERNLVGLLITTKKEELLNHLTTHPESEPVITSESVAELLSDPEIAQLNVNQRHFTLLGHVAIRAAALDPSIRSNLEAMELHQLVDAFMLSPDRQSMLESLERDE